MTYSVVPPPTTRLPSPRRLREYSLDALSALIDYLRTIYSPPVRGSRRVDRKKVGLSRAGDTSEDLDTLALLRADEFERAHAVRWLTALVSHATLLQDASEDPDGTDGSSQIVEDKIDALIRSAASLIAVCAGTAAARTLTREFSFRAPLLDPNAHVTVQLTDVPIAADSESATVGTQTWGSACLLAEMLVEDPARFGLGATGGSTEKAGEVRVLELGAGTGLVSLACAKLISELPSEPMAMRKTTIVASDYHPTVLKNLHHNIQSNFPRGAPPHVSLSADALDWSRYSPKCEWNGETAEPPFDQTFDVIFGADVIYEPQHVFWIRDCVSALLRRPSGVEGPTALAQPRFHLVMPLRPTHTSESHAVTQVFPRAPENRTLAPPSSTDLQLSVIRQETVVCEVEDARPGEEVEYVHYVIGWA